MTGQEKPPGTFGTAAYGGDNWSPRTTKHREEIGRIWQGGIDSEWRPLKSVLLHRPGPELLAAQDDPDSALMLAPVDLGRAQAEHDAMTQAFRAQNVDVYFVGPDADCPPNLMFCADLFVMTPEGAILARPASTVRAGEERWLARRLAALGVPILKTLTGNATFEGADLMWLDSKTAMIGRGLRTNQAAITQIEALLSELGIDTIAVDMPFGIMHFMSLLRIVDERLALCWPRRTPHQTVTALRERGFDVLFPEPFEHDPQGYRGINFVTLGPRRVLMVADLPLIQACFEDLGIECITTPTAELAKAAGNVGCLTGVVSRALGT